MLDRKDTARQDCLADYYTDVDRRYEGENSEKSKNRVKNGIILVDMVPFLMSSKKIMHEKIPIMQYLVNCVFFVILYRR